MERMRGPVQGVWNIIRFNWPFYALAILAIAGVLALRVVMADTYRAYFLLVAAAITVPVLVSLAVSYQIYDVSITFDSIGGDGSSETGGYGKKSNELFITS